MQKLLVSIVILSASLAQPAAAEVFRCVINGKTAFRSAAAPPEGCEGHEIRAAPFDPGEAARAAERLRHMDERERNYRAMLEQRRAEAERRFDAQIKARALEEQTRARIAAEREAEAADRASRRPVVVLPYR